MNEHNARPRRRGEALIKAIHDAALEEALAVGPGRLTMDGIARRAATPRTTLYRRWSDPVEVLLDALYHHHPVEEPTPAADDLRGDLIRSLRLMADWALSPAGRAVKAILTDPKSMALMSEALFERVFAGRGGTFTRTVLQHYADQGRFPAERLTPVAADLGEALVTKRLIDTGTAPSDEELAAIVDQAILPAVGFPPAAPR
ncbi:TetR/AcrR family transcriptional regulator C-terminal ligand-binding domain-containing protein [Nonomuraea sp. NPDC050310]|uniref:TetR/AcrR family transcriptional regulator n=1 Tax=Nonomuraea sp. NPDC050310 TaxID=3154935 RepID=UPI0033D53EA5